MRAPRNGEPTFLPIHLLPPCIRLFAAVLKLLDSNRVDPKGRSSRSDRPLARPPAPFLSHPLQPRFSLVRFSPGPCGTRMIAEYGADGLRRTTRSCADDATFSCATGPDNCTSCALLELRIIFSFHISEGRDEGSNRIWRLGEEIGTWRILWNDYSWLKLILFVLRSNFGDERWISIK